MAKDEDWLLWCRLCAKIQMKPHMEIFFKNEEKHDLVKILEQYYYLEVSEDDKLPKTVCESCYSSIENHLSFVKSINKTQEMYSDLVNCGYEDKAELFEMRQRYKIDKSDVPDQSDIKVGFIDLHPMFVCDVIVQDQNDKNPLDEPPLSNEESIFNDDHFNNNDDDDDDNDNDNDNGSANDHETIEEKIGVLAEDEIKINEADELSPEKDVTEEEEPIAKSPKPDRRRKCKKKLDIDFLKEDDTEDEDNKKRGKKDRKNNEGSKDARPKKRKVRKDKMLKKLECQECPFKSWKKNDLKWHMISKHGRPVDENPKFVCSQCSKAFRNQHYLKRHMETHLPEDQRRTWPCPHCDKLFSTSDNAKIHVQHIHFNDKKFICEECGFIAKTNGSLKKHMESHLPIPKYECQQCGARIGNKYRLKLHMDTHNPDKFPCKICNLKFSSRVTLKNHLVIHSDAMPYKCDSCGRAFKLAKYLKSHLLTHTGLKHYSCKFCDRQFAHSTNCRLHMKKEHPEQLAKLDAEGGPKKIADNVPTLQALKAFAKSVPSRTSDDEPPLFMF